jgi:hypothetical protein
MIYYLNIAVLLTSFFASLLLIIKLFAHDSVAYVLLKWQRLTLKAALIMFCIGQLHAIDGDSFDEVQMHDLFRDIGMLGLVVFVHIYMHRSKYK